MIILGLDPGIARTGYGVLDTSQSYEHVTNGCIETASSLPRGRRLTEIVQRLRGLLDTYQPQLAVIEQVFFARNKTTATATSQVHGVILHVLDEHAVSVEYVTPLSVKRQLTGQGFASKRQIQEAVTKRLSLSVMPTPDDAADALAIALTAVPQKAS